LEKLLLHDNHITATGILLVCLLVFPGSTHASTVGGESGAYLRYPVGAAAFAMGGALSAAPASLAPWWNPAVLSRYKERIGTLGGGIRPMGQSDGYASFEFRVPPRMGMGLFLLYRGDPFLDNIYDENENKVDRAAFTSFTGKIALSYYISRKLSAGANLSIRYEKLPSDFSGTGVMYTSATSIGSFDFALSYLYSNSLTLALLLKDVGSRMDWNFTSMYDYSVPQEDRALPSFILGSSYRTTLANRPFIWNFDLRTFFFTGDWKKLDRPQASLATGWEWHYWKEFTVRAGVGDLLVNGTITDGSGFYRKNFSFRLTGGLGVDLARLKPGLRLNYGFSTDKVWAGLDQQIDIAYSF
jgi:hypothetical protein